MYLDRLEYKKDVLRPIDVRCRFISAVILLITVVDTANLAALLIVIGVCVIMLSREPRITLLRLIPVNIVLAAVWISVLFGLSVSGAVLYTLRINAAALIYMSFIVPVSISALASSMTKLKIPEKLVSLFILTYRYIFLMSGRLSTALISMRLRAPKNREIYMWRNFAAVFAATTTAAVLRARRTSIAMISRGFNGAFPVTHIFRWKFYDTAFLALCVIASLAIICVNYI